MEDDTKKPSEDSDIVSGQGTVLLPDDDGDVELGDEPVVPASDEQALEIEEEAPPAEEAKEEPPEEKKFFDIPEAKAGGAPAWVRVPKGFKFPKGRQIIFVRFRAEWTDTPEYGHGMSDQPGRWRQCIIWPLSDADEKHALNRAMGDINRAPGQLAKQMVRAIDGHEADFGGSPSPGNIDRWWDQIGGRCRGQLIRLYTQLHVLGRDEQKLFFESCVAVRSTG